jgi:hypothetical protein
MTMTYTEKELNALKENEADFRSSIFRMIEAMHNLAAKCWMPDETRTLLRNIAEQAKTKNADADVWIGFRDEIERRKNGIIRSAAELDFLCSFKWAVEAMTYSYTLMVMPTNGLPYHCLRRAAESLATLTANY